MKHGHSLPADQRDEMAREALAIFQRTGIRARALEEIEARFDVSNPTARNLLGRGQTLAEDQAAQREQAIREKAHYGGHAALWRSKNGPTSRR